MFKYETTIHAICKIRVYLSRLRDRRMRQIGQIDRQSRCQETEGAPPEESGDTGTDTHKERREADGEAREVPPRCQNKRHYRDLSRFPW